LQANSPYTDKLQENQYAWNLQGLTKPILDPLRYNVKCFIYNIIYLV